MKIAVYGAGGHGKVVADILIASGHTVPGFLDDRVSAGELVLGLPVLGGDEWLRANGGSLDGVALGIGLNEARSRVAARIKEAGVAVMTAIHPRAVVSPSVRIGEGTVVMANAIINADAVIEAGAIINTGSVVEHDCRIGEYAHIGSDAALGGGVTVGAFTQVGIGVAMSNNITVGAHSIIGAGSAVVRPIGDYVVAYGVPARRQRDNRASKREGASS